MELSKPPLIAKAKFEEPKIADNDPTLPHHPKSALFYSQDLGSVNSEPFVEPGSNEQASISAKDSKKFKEKDMEVDLRMTFGKKE